MPALPGVVTEKEPHSVSAGLSVVGFPPLADSAVEKAYTFGPKATLACDGLVSLPKRNLSYSQGSPFGTFRLFIPW
jgi:hypothetical protein